jgi:hypothetical protein
MALSSNSALIAAAREDIAGFDDDRQAGGGVLGPPTAQQRDEQKASIEAERAEYAAAGDVANVAACDDALERLAAAKVVDAAGGDGSRKRVTSGGLFGEPLPPPRPRTDNEKAAYRASVERERAKYEHEGDAAGVQACDQELRNATA